MDRGRQGTPPTCGRRNATHILIRSAEGRSPQAGGGFLPLDSDRAWFSGPWAQPGTTPSALPSLPARPARLGLAPSPPSSEPVPHPSLSPSPPSPACVCVICVSGCRLTYLSLIDLRLLVLWGALTHTGRVEILYWWHPKAGI